MSYLFDATTERLTGTFASSHDGDFSIACWIKKQDWSGGGEGIVEFSVDPTDNSPSDGIVMSSTADQIQAYSRDSAGSGQFATEGVVANSADGVWWLVVGTFAGNGSQRDIYETDSTQTGTNATSVTRGTGYNDIQIGNRNTGTLGHSSGNTCLIAEVCLWDKILTAAEIDQLRLNAAVGLAPNLVAPSQVFGYYPLDTDGDLTNYGSDTGGDLTATGATWSSDHPTIHQFGLVGSATNAVASATQISFLHGLSIQEGDFIVAILNFGNDGEITSDNGMGCRHQEENPGADTARLAFFEKIATASEPATYTFSSAATAGRISGQILQFRGIDPDNPWDVPPNTMTRYVEATTTSLATDVPLTTTHANTIGLGVCTCDADGTTFSGYTVGSNEIEHGTGQSLASVSEIYTTAGTKTAFDATASVAENITYWHIAVKADEAPATNFGAVMGISKYWTHTPPAGTQIDWSNPITADLQILGDFIDGWPVNRVTQEVGSIGDGSPYVTAHEIGMVAHVDEAGSPNDIFVLPKIDHAVVGRNAVTFLALVRSDSNPVAVDGYAFGYAGTGFDPFFIGESSTDDVEGRITVDGTVYADVLTDGILNGPGRADVFHVIAGKWSSSANTLYTYCNKVKSGGTATGGGSVLSGDVSTNNRPTLGSNHPTAGSPYTGLIAYCAQWSRELSDDEIYSLVDNPFQLYQPQRTFIPIEFAVATPPVITDVANSGETPGSGTETWQDGSTGNVITGTGFM